MAAPPERGGPISDLVVDPLPPASDVVVRVPRLVRHLEDIPTNPSSQQWRPSLTGVGSSGEKRKGRQHLPKVGSPKEMAWELHEEREQALHPFSDRPDRRLGPAAAIIAVLIIALVIVAVVAFVALS